MRKHVSKDRMVQHPPPLEEARRMSVLRGSSWNVENVRD